MASINTTSRSTNSATFANWRNHTTDGAHIAIDPMTAVNAPDEYRIPSDETPNEQPDVGDAINDPAADLQASVVTRPIAQDGSGRLRRVAHEAAKVTANTALAIGFVALAGMAGAAKLSGVAVRYVSNDLHGTVFTPLSNWATELANAYHERRAANGNTDPRTLAIRHIGGYALYRVLELGAQGAVNLNAWVGKAAHGMHGQMSGNSSTLLHESKRYVLTAKPRQ